ncbi:MAG: right-handed parallel beta-helix repeat-containing protein [Wenzhouxiangella sp.]
MGHRTEQPTPRLTTRGLALTLLLFSLFVGSPTASAGNDSHALCSTLASAPLSIPRDGSNEAWSIDSGAWSDPTIWSSGMVPDENTRVLVSHGTHVSIGGPESYSARSLVIHGVFEVVDTGTGAHPDLTVDWVHVNGEFPNGIPGTPGGALFRIGRPNDRFQSDSFTLTLAGTDIGDKLVEIKRQANPGEPAGMNNRALMTVLDNDGFLMTAMGGRLEMYGQDKISFTKLAETAEAGQTEILVHNVIERNFSDGASDENGFITSAEDDGELNWTMGDKIVVTSTDYDYRQFSRATITGISDQGDGTSLLSLDQPLSFRHFGEVETYLVPDSDGTFTEKPLDMRAEVALLSRNIVIQGLAGQDTDIEPGDRALAEFMPRQHTPFTALDPEVQDTQVANGIGGHIMIMGSAIRDNVIDGVQLNLMGQSSRRGRYPIHWHIAGDRGANPDQNRSGDLLRNSVVTNSNNRGVVIHGTSGVRVEGVTLFDVHGHGFFLEDAVEVDNEFIANLAIAIHTVGGEDGPFPNNNIFNPCAGSLPCRLSDPVLVDAFQNMNRGFESNGNPRQPRNDPFIVDTHDLFQVFESRGAGSAAFWITNPDNRFIGNISAGTFGAGFWYILPRMPIGESAYIMANTDWSDEENLNAAQRYLRGFLKGDINPDGYSPNELPTVFDYNTAHSTPTGFTIFRGEDIEGGAVDPNHISPEGLTMDDLGLTPNNNAAGMYRAAARTNNQNLTITGYRGWKARGAATYILYNGNLVFEDAQIADSMMGIFAPRVRAHNSLLVGDSRGNADHSLPVSLMTFYDRWNAIDGSHVAGLEREDAHLYMFDKQLVSAQISDYVRGVTFEDDGSRDSISIGFGYSGPHWVTHSWSRSILDVDGSLTGHVGGGPGTVLVPDIPFMVGNAPEFTRPQGWGVYITPITHARLNILVPRDNFAGNNPNRNWSIRSPEGIQYDVFRGVGFNTPGHGQLQGTQFNIRSRQQQPLNETYAIDFSNADSRDGKIVIMMDMDQENVPRPESDFFGAAVLQITGAGSRVPSIGEQKGSEIDLRNASDTAYFWDLDQETLWLKVFVEDSPVIELLQTVDDRIFRDQFREP